MDVNVVKLGDYIKIQTGKLDANASDVNGIYPFFTCAVEPLQINTYAYDCECILVAGNGDLNVKYYNGKFNAYQRTYIIEIKNKELDIRYLYHFLTKYINILRKNSIGGVIKYIKLGDLTDIKLSLPSIDEQQKIVSILDKADEIRTKKKQANEKLNEFLKSTFVEMFGDPKLNNKNLTVTSIKDLCQTMTGSTPKKDNLEYYNSKDIPWVKTGEVINSYINNSTEYITHKAIKETNCKLFPVDTILVAMYGQGLTRGRVGMLKIPATTNQACCAILPSENINQEFLFNQLKIQYKTLRDFGRGGNQPNLNMDIIKNFEIIFPPIEEQNKFAQIVKKVEAQKQKNEEVLKQMDNLFNSLSQKAFKGEL